MFLTQVKSKGRTYIYLHTYTTRTHYSRTSEKVFSFGRSDKALMKLYAWKSNFKKFPNELIDLGCNRNDLEEWIRTLETGITKTGKIFKAIV